MEKKHRIHWKRGLEITPEIFVASDEYHIAERELISLLLSSRFYGVLPESKFFIEKEIIGNSLVVNNLNCFAMTREGTVISIPKETRFNKELSLSEAMGNECYVVLSVNPKGKIPEDDGAPFIYPDYYLSFVNTSESVERGMPILKIKNNNYWEIDNNYLPPSVALNSLEKLFHVFVEIRSIINKIIEKYPEKNIHFFQLEMLQLELNSFTPKKFPEELALLMKKFCKIFYSHLISEKKLTNKELMKNFMEETFNPNEIEKFFKLGWGCFEEINTFFDAKPVDDIPILEIKV